MSTTEEEGPRPEPPPPDVRKAFRNYSKLDEDIKNFGKTVKQARTTLKENQQLIIQWMLRAHVTKVCRDSGKGDPVTFLLVEKDVYVRPTQEQQSQKMAELIREGVTDPERIVKELKHCAGTRKEAKLHRRKPRKQQKKKKQKKQQAPEKKRVTFSDDQQ